MKLRFFCDHCVPWKIVEALRGFGAEVSLLRDHLPIRAVDDDVIAKAQALGAILLPLNGDFADIVRFPPSRYGGIVALQLHDHPEAIPTLMASLGQFLVEHDDPAYFQGKLLVVEPRRIRVRS